MKKLKMIDLFFTDDTSKRDQHGRFVHGNFTGKWFIKGGKPWNKGMKGFDPSPETHFKKGEHIGEKHPSWKGGVQQTQDDGVYVWTGVNKRMRRPRKVYEDTYGKIPKGYVIYHKNGDRNDDRPENLEAISRAELMKRNNPKN